MDDTWQACKATTARGKKGHRKKKKGWQHVKGLKTTCDFSLNITFLLYFFLTNLNIPWLLLFLWSLFTNLYFFSILLVKRLGSNPGRFANATLVRLSEYLSAGYKKGVRPVKDWRDSTMVAIDLMVYSILNVVSTINRTKPRLIWSGTIYFLFTSDNEMYDVCVIQDEKNQVLTTYVWYRQVG